MVDMSDLISKEVVIIGGGLAGLCAANRLADLGCPCTLLEAGHYPAHKVCGEFLSPECLSLLSQWNIRHIAPISRARFQFKTVSCLFDLPQSAGGLSHFQLDPQLAQRALQQGVDVRTGICVLALEPPKHQDAFYTITLSSGEILRARQVVFATGRLPGLATAAPPQMCYMGFKAHFANIDIDDWLEMYTFPGGYLGLAPIEEGKINCACLVRLNGKTTQGDGFIQRLIENNPTIATRLSKAHMLSKEWMTGIIPEFGIKPVPAWSNGYFIGDAVGTIPPACGEGLAMAITSGYMVADYVARNHYMAFRKAWYRHYARRIQIGKWLHAMLMNPTLAQLTIRTSQFFPLIPRTLFRLTRS